MTAIASFNAVVKVGGTPVVMTGEAAAFVSGKTYQITNTAKRVVDPATAVVVKDNAVTVAAANILSFDFLFGIVVFVPGYTVTGPVTIDGAYIPTGAVGDCKAFEFSVTCDLADRTTFDSAGARQKLLCLVDCSGSLSRLTLPLDDLDAATGGTQSLDSWMKAGTPKLIEVLWTTGARRRAWVIFKAYKVTGQLTGLVEVSVEFDGAAQTLGASFGMGT